MADAGHVVGGQCFDAHIHWVFSMVYRLRFGRDAGTETYTSGCLRRSLRGGAGGVLDRRGRG